MQATVLIENRLVKKGLT